MTSGVSGWDMSDAVACRAFAHIPLTPEAHMFRQDFGIACISHELS